MAEPQFVKRPFKERVLLVIAVLGQRNIAWSEDLILQEMTELVVACGGEVVEHYIAHVKTPSARNLIGEGKVSEIMGMCNMKVFDLIIFSEDLKGSQQRNLEEEFKIKTIDRTQLILDIFARRAKSQEGKMQVELAQMEYMLPRLVGHGVELSRLGGGIGTVGPGETKLEIDRRRIQERITRLKRSLKEVAAEREVKRKKRKEKNIPSISIVGYTNAGKSTLLNALTTAQQETVDGLFTTLDSISRQLVLPNKQKVIISDTVGFMHELPHHLIEAFKATLEEVQDADLLLHVIDVSNPQFRLMEDAVTEVLLQLNAVDKPMIIVLNKIDKIEDRHWIDELKKNYNDGITISATTGENIPELLTLVEKMLPTESREIEVNIPLNRMDLVNLAHKEGEVYSVKYYPDSINIRARIPSHLLGKFNVKP